MAQGEAVAAQMGSFERWWQTSVAAGIEPIVLIAGVVIYTMLRNITYKGREIEKWQALLIVWPVNILGQIRVASGISAWDDVLFFSIVQTGLAFGVYSLADALGFIKLAKGAVNKFAKDKGVEVPTDDTPKP